MRHSFGKRANGKRIRGTLEKASQLALGIQQRQISRRSVIEEERLATSWNSGRL